MGLVLPWAVLSAVIGAVVTLSIFLSTVIFRMGQHSARLEALENWRKDIRVDMHEISDRMEELTGAVGKLTTLIEERTDRRAFHRGLSERPAST